MDFRTRGISGIVGGAALIAILLVPGLAQAKPSCHGKKATVVLGGGNNKFVAKHNGHGTQVVIAGAGIDTIVTGKGPDVICGGDGNDRLQGGKGKDRVYGGTGDDVITNIKGKDSSYGEDGNDQLLGGPSKESMDGGIGNDLVNGSSDRDSLHGGLGDDLMVGDDGSDDIWGDDGTDEIHGGSGGEDMFGGSGDDRMYGDLLDDRMDGGSGADLLVGGHGTDAMRAGDGDDWMRGGPNGDSYNGEGGTDTISYADETPANINGVLANLPIGTAVTPDGNETIGGIENVLGSAFEDTITGTGAANDLDGGPGDDDIIGGGGSDALNGGPGNDSCDLDRVDKVTSCGLGAVPETPPDIQLNSAFVFLDPRGPDPGLYVIGRPAAVYDDLLVTASGSGFTVNSPAGTPIVRLPDPINLCSHLSNGATCSTPTKPLSFITAWGGDGNDSVKLAGSYPPALTAVLNGGPGNDALEGSSGDDMLYSGRSGNDTMRGGEGSDALLALGTGGDTLVGGGGNDQMVTDDPCQGHDYQGGTGFDIAGFARYALALTGKTGVQATLGGTATDPGRAGCSATQIRGDMEILEGSSGPDELTGTSGNNPFISGRGGDDVIHGGGGADTLTGDGGNDSIYGDAGFDTLESQDGSTDKAVHCGAGGGEAVRDASDPVRGCKKLKKGKRKRK